MLFLIFLNTNLDIFLVNYQNYPSFFSIKKGIPIKIKIEIPFYNILKYINSKKRIIYSEGGLSLITSSFLSDLK